MLFNLLPDSTDFTHPRCSVHESTLSGARSFVLDNGVFTLSLLPEFGGRMCSLFYRPLNLELLATEFLNSAPHGFHVRGGWCAAFPSLLPDGEVISRQPWDCEIIEQSDDQVAVRLWCLVERTTHLLDGQTRVTPGTIAVERIVRLRAGEAAVDVQDVLTNRNIWPMPTTWSGVLSLRAHPGDRAIVPVDAVEVQRGVGPSGNELDFGLLMSTPYQALARNLREGWLDLRPAAAPVDIRLTFPKALLPHAVIAAQRDERRPMEDAFRLQPLATASPLADDSRGGALLLPPKKPINIPLRLEVGAGLITGGEWSRPGLQLAEMITAQRVPTGRVAVWRLGDTAIAVKNSRYLIVILPGTGEGTLLESEDMPAADFILCAETPSRAVLNQLAQRTAARFIGPAPMRQLLLEDGIGEERAISLSPGARFDLPGLDILATPSRRETPGEQLGFLLQVEHLTLYFAGRTQFLGEFGPIGEQFHPQLVFLPLGGMNMSDAVHAAKLLQPRMAVPLGSEEVDIDFVQRCRAQHLSFAAHALYQAEGCLFDGWHLNPLA
ncbi:MAG: MBL fold metallo-hydrolase [Armatimonadota bacterium]